MPRNPLPIRRVNGRGILSILIGTVVALAAVLVLLGPRGGPSPFGGQLEARAASAKTDAVTGNLVFGEVFGELAVQPQEPGAGQREEEPNRAGLVAYLAACFALGLAAALSPCFYPMIPITVGFFLRQSEARRAPPLLLAGIYSLTIVISFTLAGLLLQEALSTLGTGPEVSLALGLLLLLLGLSLLGLFELPVPQRLVDWVSRGQSRGGVVGVVCMALALLLVGTPCIAPFWGPVLVGAPAGMGIVLGSLVFSLAIAIPFFVLAIAPGLLPALPKGGSWMQVVKVLGGLVLIAISVKFFVAVDQGWQLGWLSRSGGLSVLTALALAGSLYLFGLVPLGQQAGQAGISPGRMVLAILALASAVYLGSGFLQPLHGLIEAALPAGQPAMVATTAEPQAEQVEWRQLAFDEALAEGRRLNRPVMLNFTGQYCYICKIMERSMLPRPAIQQRLAHMVPVELVTDRGTPRDEANREVLLERFEAAGVPFYAVVSPAGVTLETFSGGTTDEQRFVAFLDAALDQWQQHRDRSSPGGNDSNKESPR